mmetsp:Transcript_25459/g.84211  ORF Transcript_25459/g.84211 Transcript_25459/m.84211 type:complete len:638 (-) Transcript_25459:136-2049(-)
MSRLKNPNKDLDIEYERLESLSGMQFLQSWSNGLEQVCRYDYEFDNSQQEDDVFQRDIEDQDDAKSRQFGIELFCDEPHSDEEIKETLSSLTSLVLRPSSLATMGWEKFNQAEEEHFEDEPSLYSLCNMNRLYSEQWTPTAASSSKNVTRPSNNIYQQEQEQHEHVNVIKKANHAHVSMLHVPAVTEVPILKPSFTELNNLPEFLKSIDAVGRFHGAVKIVPPTGWLEQNSKHRATKLDSWKFCRQSRVYLDDHECGWYSIKRQEQQTSDFPTVKSSLVQKSEEYEEWREDGKTLEIEFWRDVGAIGQEVETAHHEDFSLLDEGGRNFLGGKLSQAQHHSVSLGMSRAAEGWTCSSDQSKSLLLLHFGASKTVYVVPPAYKEKLDNLPQEINKTSFGSSQSPFSSISRDCLIDPVVLRRFEIPFHKTIVQQGEIIIHWSNSYHCHIDHGFNCSEVLHLQHHPSTDPSRPPMGVIEIAKTSLPADSNAREVFEEPLKEEANSSSQGEGDLAEEWGGEGAIRRRRKRKYETDGAKAAGEPVELKNKNCHFCEHAPKRCSIFTCTNPKCDQMFCDKCCKNHLNSPLSFRSQQEADKCEWKCPLCRRNCCCTKSVCKEDHLHCKRYRRRMKQLIQGYEYYM